MKLSIITINFNNMHGFQKTIESVVSQTCKAFEWIVIDGGSTDGSRELIEQYANHIAYWVSEPDKGIYDAMNKGIKVAKGDYLLFLNSGDYFYSKDTLEHIFQGSFNEDIIVFDMFLLRKDKIYPKKMSDLTSLSLVSFLIGGTFPHQSSLIKRSLFETIGLYNTDYKYVSDWIFFYKACVFFDSTFTYKKGSAITIYDTLGISSKNKRDVDKERKQFLKSCYSKRMYEHLIFNLQKERESINLNTLPYRLIIKIMLWVSNKLSSIRLRTHMIDK